MTLWEIDIYPEKGQPDLVARDVSAEAADLGIADELTLVSAKGYLIQGEIERDQAEQLASQLLADRIVERTVLGIVGDDILCSPPDAGYPRQVHVVPKPGVMDPVADSVQSAIADFGLRAEAVRTLRKYWLPELPDETLRKLCTRVLANNAIEQVVVGPLPVDPLDVGSPYRFERISVQLVDLDEQALMTLSREGQLYLSLAEMKTIQDHFRSLGRDPTDAELETIAQTWSEHCSHKTLAGRIAYRDEHGERYFDNMLKETIFAATHEIRHRLGSDDWCVSVFEDNAGIVRFDEHYNVVFKVETHNHPSALEPYGGANTGIGGVIRDTMGTGLGAKPVCSTDVFCFAPPETPSGVLPPGVLHPRRVMKGVVAGVRDYGNRMGIPTVNGAIYFDPRYLANPLVYCGNVGLLPRDKSTKQPRAGDWIVVLGGRTGRDGIHGATFSSAELTSHSDSVSGGAVQIGNAITEKMVLDVLLVARDRGLYNAITDCGAGGFSSAVGEMGAEIGAEVWLERAPLKYDGLSYTEIWISEAQERMVLSVPPEHWDALQSLCESEGVEATCIGKFVPTRRLQLQYEGVEVADLDMQFLHGGRPPVVRQAHYRPPRVEPMSIPDGALDCGSTLLKILSSLNVASKGWVIRQYDHEVQGGSVIKPLVGADNDGPSDAAVVRPVHSSPRGLVVGCGMNPHYGDLDTYHMAASAIDEAVRNCVAVGADPSRIAILDNFCWGHTERSETLGSLVRAALACHDLALGLGTPFISGKDSLNNEFSYQDEGGHKHTISIPPSLLISALGQVDDVRHCVTMDLKDPDNLLYVVGATSRELGGSHFALVEGLRGGDVPKVHVERARDIFSAVHHAIRSGILRACHDLSEGGLAVAAAEMALAGGWGADINMDHLPIDDADTARNMTTVAALFSESNTRFLCEIPPHQAGDFEQLMSALPCARVGQVVRSPRLVIHAASTDDENADLMVDVGIDELKEAWQAPLRW